MEFAHLVVDKRRNSFSPVHCSLRFLRLFGLRCLHLEGKTSLSLLLFATLTFLLFPFSFLCVISLFYWSLSLFMFWTLSFLWAAHLRLLDEGVRHLHHLIHRVVFALLDPPQLRWGDVLANCGKDQEKIVNLETHEFASGAGSSRSFEQRQHLRTWRGRRVRWRPTCQR